MNWNSSDKIAFVPRFSLQTVSWWKFLKSCCFLKESWCGSNSKSCSQDVFEQVNVILLDIQHCSNRMGLCFVLGKNQDTAYIFGNKPKHKSNTRPQVSTGWCCLFYLIKRTPFFDEDSFKSKLLLCALCKWTFIFPFLCFIILFIIPEFLNKNVLIF